MTSVRRFLVLQTLLLWQGGFLFYTTFVVPVGTAVLGSATAQGAITARVTDALNAVGLVGLVVAAWDLNWTTDPARRRTATRWWCWAVAAVCQGAMLILHRLMDDLMNPGRTFVVIRGPFYPLHRMYLWASTVQWAACLVLAWFTLRAWHAEDASTTSPQHEL